MSHGTKEVEMSASHLEVERHGMSSMSPRTESDAGQDVPTRGADTARILAGWMIVVTGGLVLANTAISSAGPEVTGSDWMFALLAAVVSIVAARSLWRGVRGAWWTAAAYDAVALFFVLPVMIGMLLGASRELVGAGWDMVFFPTVTAALLVLSAALWIAWPEQGSGS
jgi:hypothetical protein